MENNRRSYSFLNKRAHLLHTEPPAKNKKSNQTPVQTVIAPSRPESVAADQIGDCSRDLINNRTTNIAPSHPIGETNPQSVAVDHIGEGSRDSINNATSDIAPLHPIGETNPELINGAHEVCQ